DFGKPAIVFYTNKKFLGYEFSLTFRDIYAESTYLYFITLSPELYISLRSLATQNSIQKNNLSNLFSFPNQIISNVSGGLGFVGSCNINIIPLYQH
ncbi:MAG: DUF4249 domain-containing protein, partial [Deferribacterales bacterium]